MAWVHEDDGHGGNDKGRIGQEIVAAVYESFGCEVIKSSREQDISGIDFFFKKDDKTISASVTNTVCIPEINKNYNRIIYSGHLNNKIPGIKNSKADICVCCNASYPNHIFHQKRSHILEYVENIYGKDIKECRFAYDPLDAVTIGRPQLRFRNSVSLYDIWVLVPITEFKKLDRPRGSYVGVVDEVR